MISCLPVFIQKAALAALQGPQQIVSTMARNYEERMNLLVDGLQQIPGFSCDHPDGGLCVMVNIKAFKTKAEDLAMKLLQEAGVMTVPGSAFGVHGESFIRFCFANSPTQIQEGITRIQEYVANYSPGRINTKQSN